MTARDKRDDPCKCGGRIANYQTKFGLRRTCLRSKRYAWGGGRPLVSKAVHDARKRAHVAFDNLWKSKRMTRSEAYKALGVALNLKPDQGHMAQMDLARCEAVIAWVDEFEARQK